MGFMASEKFVCRQSRYVKTAIFMANQQF